MRDDGRVNRTRALALAGVATGLAGAVTSQATVWAMQASNGPIDAVASAVRDLTPGHFAVNLVHLVGHLDKPLLRIGTTVIFLAIAGWIGVQAHRRPWLPDLAYFVLACLGLASVLRLHNSTTGSSLGVVVGLLTWLAVHRLLTVRLAQEPDVLGEEARRAFFRKVGGVGAAVVVAGVVGDLSNRVARRVEQERKLLRLPVTQGAEPAGSTLPGSGIAPWRTPNEEFYQIATVLSSPAIPHEEWSLRVHGMVDKELVLSYDDLVARKFTEDWITIACVSNPVGDDLIGNAWWSGVLVREILAEAGVQDGADAVLQTSHDGWTCGTPLGALTDDRNALLALAMNGEPLPRDHGYPVRMVVPGLYGYVSATKWLVDIEVTRFDQFQAYWTERGWTEKGPVLTQSRIDVPAYGDQTKVGRIGIGGSAWAQHTGIDHVEFQLDGGAWQRATLGTVPDLDTWVQWSGEVEVTRGKHTLVVRATDKSGYTQTAVRTDVFPSGATGWHTIEFSA